MLNTFFNAVTKALAHSASERAAYVKRESVRVKQVDTSQSQMKKPLSDNTDFFGDKAIFEPWYDCWTIK